MNKIQYKGDKTMKKFLKNVLIGICILSMTMGCQGDNTTVKKVAVVQYMEHTSLNTIKDAFDKQMEELGYQDNQNIEYIFKNAQGDNSIAASITQTFASENPDVVVAIATPVAQSVASLSSTTPVVFAAVSDPIGAKLTSSLEKPDKNITGTSDEIQVDLILDKALEINPNLKTLGVIYNKGEANSVTNIQKAKNYAQKHGFEMKEATITNVNEVQSAIDVLATQCDAVFAPNDNTIASAMNVVSHSCIQSQVPLYVGADSMVQDGGFLSVGIDYEELGRETANMVDQILNGSNVSDIPVKVFKDDLKIYVNQDVMTQIDVELPENIIQDSSLVMM